MTIADNGMAERAAFGIERWGIPAHLLRGDEARDCVAAQLMDSPRARSLALEGAKSILVAAPLEIEPDHELDRLVYNGKLYNIVSPVKGPRPGDIAIYFELEVVYEQTFDITPYLPS